jgi:hypothetical protein
VIEASVVVAAVMAPAEIAAEIAVEVAGRRDLRQQLAADDVDVVAGGEFGKAGRDDAGAANDCSPANGRGPITVRRFSQMSISNAQ